MKFNKAEISLIAQDPAHNFNKEGVLEFVEKQEGFFKSVEVRTDRWCRLRGNLLFYFKSQDLYSDPLGVLVLENCYVRQDDYNDIANSFTLVYDDTQLTLVAPNRQEKQLWINLMQRASFTYMRREISSMIRKIQNAKPSPPITIESYRNSTGTIVDLNKPPFLELCISCDNLRCDGKGVSPNPRVSVYVMKHPDDQWILYAQTEVIEKTSNPNFSTTITFRETDGLDNQTRVCLMVSNVKDRMSDTCIHIGKTMMTIQSIKQIEVSRLRNKVEKTRLYLLSPDKATVGFITLSSWSLDSDGNRKRETMGNPTPEHMRNYPLRSGYHRRTQSLPPVLDNDVVCPPNRALAILSTNPTMSSFRFHSGLGGDINGSEIIVEPKTVFEFPQQLLKLWIEEEIFSRDEMFSLGQLTDEWDSTQTTLLTQHSMLISLFEVGLDALKQRALTGHCVRKSIEKEEECLAFAPLNLHIHRFCASNDSLRHYETYDTVTVGAFSANSLGFSNGGLDRLISSLAPTKKDKTTDKATVCYNALIKICYLRREITGIMRTLLNCIQEQNCDKLLENTHKLHEKIYTLRRVLCPKLVTEAFNFLDVIKVPDHSCNLTLASKSQSLDLEETEESQRHESQIEKSIEDILDTSLDNYYKSTDEPEPWDLIQLNIKASIICLCSKVKAFCDKYAGQLNTKEICVQEVSNLVRNDSGIFSDRSASISQDACSNNAKDCTQTLFSSCFLTPDPSPSDEVSRQLRSTRQVIESFSYPSQSANMPSPTVLQQRPLLHTATTIRGPNKSLDEEEKQVWLNEVSPSLRKLRHALDSLVRTARLTHSLFRLQDSPERVELKYSIKYRESICFSQALTSLVAALLTKFWCGKLDSNLLWVYTTLGPLVQFEGLLSYYRSDGQRVSDMMIAIRQLADVEFLLVAGGSLQSDTIENSQITKIPAPSVKGTRHNLRVILPVPEQLLSLIPAKESTYHDAPFFKVTPVFFNIGINEEATISAKLGRDKQQNRHNFENYEILCSYFHRYQTLCPEEDTRRNTLSGPSNRRKVKSLNDLLNEMKNQVLIKKSKNVNVLQLASKICRRMGGIRFTSCKSAKDRTAMSVTLEQVNLLRQDFDLAENEKKSALDCIRMEGVRLSNCKKNTSFAKYSFSSMQLATFPHEYKPPLGTFSSNFS